MTETELARAISDYVRGTVANSPFNELGQTNVPVVDEPIVGFADGKDPVIAQFKAVIGPNHRSPIEAWADVFPDEQPPASLSIIAFALPFSETVRASNRGCTTEPSIEWIIGKAHCDAMLNELKDGLVSFIKDKGYRAIIPSKSPTFHVEYGTPTGIASNWSERHYCYAAGLGTFGLSRGLITKRGVAMRCGSIVADAALPASPRPHSHTAYCPFLESGDCDECIQRCPADAITSEGKDNLKCRAYLNEVIGPLILRHLSQGELQRLGVNERSSLSACGLCQTNVPCEAGVPN